MDNSKRKIIQIKLPSPGYLLVFWLIAICTPLLLGKFLLSGYSEHLKKEKITTDKIKLIEDVKNFYKALEIKLFIQNSIQTAEKDVLLPNLQNFAIEAFFNKLKNELGTYPRNFCFRRGSNSTAEQHFPLQSDQTFKLPGKRALEIFMNYLRSQATANNAPLPEYKKRMLKQIKAKLVSSYHFPKIKPGNIVSGFSEKHQGCRYFFYYNIIHSETDAKGNLEFFLIFKESDINFQKFFSWAKNYKLGNEIQRSFEMKRTNPNIGFEFTNNSTLSLSKPIPSRVLRYGSHTRKDLYTKLTKPEAYLIKPAKYPFITSSKKYHLSKDVSEIFEKINFAIFLFLCTSLIALKWLINNRGIKLSISRKLAFSIIFCTILPLSLFFILSKAYIAFHGNLKQKIVMQKMNQLITMLELTLKNQDTKNREKLENLRNQIGKLKDKPEKEIKKFFNSKQMQDFAGYYFVRNDGLDITSLPRIKNISEEEKNKLAFLSKLLKGQIYSIFSLSGVLSKSAIKKIQSKPSGKNILALGKLFCAQDRNAFCLQDGEYFPTTKSSRIPYRLITFNLFPENSSNESWAVMVFIQSYLSFIEKMLSQNISAWNFFVAQNENYITNTAIFATKDLDGKKLDLTKVWPPSAIRDKGLLEAARRITEERTQNSWISLSEKGIPTLFAGRQLNGFPIIAVSRTIMGYEVAESYYWDSLMLVFILYSTLLIIMIGACISSIFITPIKSLLYGIESLTMNEFPVLPIPPEKELAMVTKRFNKMVTEMKERKILERFISPEATSLIIEESKDLSDRKSKKIEKTVFFAHIRNFINLTDKTPPKDLVKLLNQYFSVMEPIISQYSGTVDKYIGDAIMATFSAENINSSPEENACLAALNFLKALEAFNNSQTSNNQQPLKIGIGIAAGTVISGKVGAQQGRKDFTVIGDTVNLAARLESKSHYDENCHIFVSESVFIACKKSFIFISAGELDIKGKSQPVMVYELKGKQ